MGKQLSNNEMEDFYSEKVLSTPCPESPVFITISLQRSRLTE